MDNKANDVITTALDQRWEVTLNQRKACRGAFPEKFVHDLRVATRRLLAVYEFLDVLDPQAGVRKVRRKLKHQLDNLDKLRDVQVMLIEATASLERMPGLALLQAYLQKREQSLKKEAQIEIQSFKPKKMRKDLAKIRDGLEIQGRDKDFSLHLIKAIDGVFSNCVKAYDGLDATKPASIHRLRIVFKKFRYMIEIVLPLVQGHPSTQLEHMHAYQSAMGDIQDIEVLLGTLSTLEKKKGFVLDQELIHTYYEKRHTEIISAYFQNKAELFTFWRTAADQPFPWEK